MEIGNFKAKMSLIYHEKEAVAQRLGRAVLQIAQQTPNAQLGSTVVSSISCLEMTDLPCG